jgi:uroporphyrinogen III methyltransferase/synthase
LTGRKILVTRSSEQASEFVDLLRDKGAEVLQVSVIRFDPPDSWEAADRAIQRLNHFSAVLFTSANAVECFLRRLKRWRLDSPALSPLTLAAIGPGTARALREHGLHAGVVPDRFVAEGLLASLEGSSLEGKEILIPRAQEAREVLPAELERRGARVTVAPVYRTVRAEENRGPLRSALRGGVDMATFTASSTVNHFLDLLGPEGPLLIRGVKIACIGEVTAQAARARGLVPDVTAGKSTVQELAAAIVRYFSSTGTS